MGVTLVSGEPVMCVLIIAGTNINELVEMGIKNDATMIGKEGDDFFLKTILAKINFSWWIYL